MKHKVIPSHYFTVKEQSLVSLVCQGKSRFIIPYNQRPWSWQEKHLKELWQDIKRTTNNFFEAEDETSEWTERNEPIGDPHFLGAFVFEEKGNDYSVVDGQQRLTSITMFVSALKNATELLQQKARGQLKKSIKHYLENFRAWLIADFTDDVVFTRLKVDDKYADFFSEYIVEAESEDERKAFLEESDIDLSQEPVLLSYKKAFDKITDMVDIFLSDFNTEEKKYTAIKAIFSTIENSFICIAADVRQESFSYEVFKCLNAKGWPLSQADKLKNELFTQSKISEHEEIKKYWDMLQSNTPYGAVAQFIRIRHVALIGECPESKLHALITEKELEEIGVIKVVSNWAEDSSIYSYLTLHQLPSKTKAFTEEELCYLNDLSTLKITLSTILTFAAYKKYFDTERGKFVELLRLTRNFCFRNLTICKKDTGFLDTNLGRAARDIMAGKPLKEVRSSLRKLSPDSEFEEAFSTFSSNTAKQQFLILNSLESFYLKESGLQPKPHGEELNIEHVMPKKFDIRDTDRSDEWKWAKDNEEAHKAYINRLGNLCLLEGEINKDVSSFDFDAKAHGNYPQKYLVKKGGQKRRFYMQSTLPSVKQIKTKYATWSFEAILERQRELACDAVKVWTLDAPNLN